MNRQSKSMDAQMDRRMDMGIDRTASPHRDRGARKTPLDLYMLAIGLFLLISPWLYAFAQEPARVNNWLIGAALVVASAAALLVFGRWQEWLVVALGLWLLAAPWALGYAHTAAMHVSIFAGLVVTYLALLELWLIHDGRLDGAHRQDASLA